MRTGLSDRVDPLAWGKLLRSELGALNLAGRERRGRHNDRGRGGGGGDRIGGGLGLRGDNGQEWGARPRYCFGSDVGNFTHTRFRGNLYDLLTKGGVRSA